MNNEIIGKFIATLRKEKNLTQKDLADKLHITDKAVSKWERGICLPDIMLFEEIASIFDVSVSELLKGERMKKNKGISEKDVVSVMASVEMNVKNKYKYIINTLLIVLSITITVIVTCSILKPIYYMHKTYKANVASSSVLIKNVQSKIEYVKSHQGRFTDDEYKAIIAYVNSIENNRDLDKDNELYLKDEYTYDDIFNYDSKKTYLSMTFDIYKILNKYDNSKIIVLNNNINGDIASYEENLNKLIEFKDNIYVINSKLGNNIGQYFKLTLWNSYAIYYQTLNDVMEVGGMNE